MSDNRLDNIPTQIQNLSDALNAIGLKSFVGKCNWANGDNGFVVHAGEEFLEFHNDTQTKPKYTKDSILSFCFNSSGKLLEIETQSRNIYIQEIFSENARLEKDGDLV